MWFDWLDSIENNAEYITNIVKEVETVEVEVITGEERGGNESYSPVFEDEQQEITTYTIEVDIKKYAEYCNIEIEEINKNKLIYNGDLTIFIKINWKGEKGND